MLIVESSSLDVYRNLAIEEYLMEYVTDDGPVLFLWRSDCAVVMGKNQNPWRECRLDLMREEGVPLARRISGGGTVYHDAGNLNYCVITSREEYCECDAFKMILRALETFGVNAEQTGKSNLSVGGFKFSGNAFSFRKGRALHHGTLLLNTDLKRLNRYLGSMFDHIKTRAIPSIPAEVMNLELDVAAVSDAIRKSFCAAYGDENPAGFLAEDRIPSDFLTPLVAHQKALEWQYDATPKFSLEAGSVRLGVEKGRIVEAEGAGAERFLNTPFHESAFSIPCVID